MSKLEDLSIGFRGNLIAKNDYDNNDQYLFRVKAIKPNEEYNSIEYLVPITQNIQEQTFYSTNVIYRIPFFNPIKIIFWRAQLLSNYNANDLFNYTLDPVSITTNKIISQEHIVLNSINRIEIGQPEYYSLVQIYQNKFTSPQEGIHMYSFCINPVVSIPLPTHCCKKLVSCSLVNPLYKGRLFLSNKLFLIRITSLLHGSHLCLPF